MKTGYIAAILDAYELVITLGEEQGIQVGMTVQVMARKEQDITDPITSMRIGTIPPVIEKIAVIEVHPKLAI